ncbi:MAG: sensor histidine kinase [Bacteroidota bacterium]
MKSEQQGIDKIINKVGRRGTALKEQARLVNELQTVNTKLVESERVKTQFLSNIRNEINNPLTSIIGLSQIISKGIPESTDLEKIGHLIHQEAFLLDFQLRNIFIAAELESGLLLPEPSNIDLKKLIHQVEREFTHQLKKKRVELDITFCINDEEFYSDREKIHMILINLVSNAIKYSPEGSLINVYVSQDSKQATITIRDYGMGICLSAQKAIFDRFKQLDTGTTKNHEGHGLGLSITRELVDLLGGSIEFESNLNSGCTFKVQLPKMDSSEPSGLAFGDDEFLFDNGNEIF